MPERSEAMGIFAGLVKAVDWYDNSLQSILASRGLKVVNRTQAMMLIHIVAGITRPSEIARVMRTTRQNIHAMAKELLRENIIVLLPDPDDRRSRQYRLSGEASNQRDAVIEILGDLNKRLADRIGKDTVRDLWRALSADWGDLITDEGIDG